MNPTCCNAATGRFLLRKDCHHELEHKGKSDLKWMVRSANASADCVTSEVFFTKRSTVTEASRLSHPVSCDRNPDDEAPRLLNRICRIPDDCSENPVLRLFRRRQGIAQQSCDENSSQSRRTVVFKEARDLRATFTRGVSSRSRPAYESRRQESCHPVSDASMSIHCSPRQIPQPLPPRCNTGFQRFP